MVSKDTNKKRMRASGIAETFLQRIRMRKLHVLIITVVNQHFKKDKLESAHIKKFFNK